MTYAKITDKERRANISTEASHEQMTAIAADAERVRKFAIQNKISLDLDNLEMEIAPPGKHFCPYCGELAHNNKNVNHLLIVVNQEYEVKDILCLDCQNDFGHLTVLDL